MDTIKIKQLESPRVMVEGQNLEVESNAICNFDQGLERANINAESPARCQRASESAAPIIRWEPELLQKYNVAGPRYTSYPTALAFNDDYDSQDYVRCLESVEDDKILSLYIHIPFCQNICYYCACNKVISKNKALAEPYVESLVKEIALVARRLKARKLGQLHWGGGTPTYLNMAQFSRIMEAVERHFDVLSTAKGDELTTEISIEIDPRALAIEDISQLAKLGFNRLSLGVQDFDEAVQKSINRIQSFELTRDMTSAARTHGFESINFDLIYGLPLQSTSSFESTLEQVIEISPDRISVFNYAHLPHRFKPQRRINTADIPQPEEKLQIFEYIMERLQRAGYLYIGMDHFAKPDDELALAQVENRLHRNFQGYATHEEYQLIGLGVSAIGNLNNQYHQNVRDLESYYKALSQNELPTWRGMSMSFDDCVRKHVIFSLICHFEVTIAEVEAKFNINFNAYFERELLLLAPFTDDHLVVTSQNRISVTPRGRLLIRNICMAFDGYLNELSTVESYSKVI